MEKNYGYESPRVEVVEVEVEKGFALSPGGGDDTGMDSSTNVNL